MEVRNWWKTRKLVELFVTQDDLCKSHHCLRPVQDQSPDYCNQDS
jgi:hypothetical protein